MTSLAETKELKQMAVYSEPALLRDTSLQFIGIMASEINDYAAVGTNQVMVVLRGTNCVAAASTASRQLTDKSQFGQYLKGAVNGYQPNIGLVLMHLLINGSRRKVVLAGGDGSYHCPSLWRKLIGRLP